MRPIHMDTHRRNPWLSHADGRVLDVRRSEVCHGRALRSNFVAQTVPGV